MKVYKNLRSGVIHTRDCGNLKQMLNENLKELEVVDPRHIEGKLSVCHHCLSRKSQEQILAWKFIHEKEKLEHEKQEKLQEEWNNYKVRRNQLAMKRDKHLKAIIEKEDKKLSKLEEKYKKLLGVS